MFFVYILKSKKDKELYIAYTNDLRSLKIELQAVLKHKLVWCGGEDSQK